LFVQGIAVDPSLSFSKRRARFFQGLEREIKVVCARSWVIAVQHRHFVVRSRNCNEAEIV